mmetsp:Transcript_53982/g.89074  ORF Transcript_53982/g.89074 Transcript_53982/m.89074 type:complete len:218 (-) Transcript_53982:502-1155(-)
MLGPALDDEALVIRKTVLCDALGNSKVGRLKYLLTIVLDRSQRNQDCPARCLGNTLQIVLLAPADPNDPCLHHVLHADVVNALGSQDDVGTRRDDLHDPLLGHIDLAPTDGLQFLRVAHDDLNTELQFGDTQVKIQERNLGVRNRSGHGLARSCAVQRKPVDELRLVCTFPVLFQDADGFDRVDIVPKIVNRFDAEHRLCADLGEVVDVTRQDLGRH